MPDWLPLTEEHAWWIAAASAAMLLIGIVTLPWLLALIPRDYFVTHPVPLSMLREYPVLRYALLGIRNLFGAVFLLLGIIMLFAPGQGVITMLVGISLMTFPGKRDLELRLIRIKGVLRTINWIRTKSGHAPLELPDDCDAV